MIELDNWKPSIIRTVAGNSSYRFQNQIFESDKLRIEVKLLNPSIQAQALPLELTIEYQESIKDELFLIVPNYKKSIAEIVENIKLYPFKLSLFNPNKSPISVLVSLPKIQPVKRRIMPFYSEEGTQSAEMSALLAATQATNEAIAGLTQVVTETSATELETANEDWTVLDPVIHAVGTVPELLSAANDNNRGLILNNQGNTKIKLFVTDNVLPPTTGYASGGHILDMTTKGIYEVPEKFVKTNVYAIGHAAGGSVSVSLSTKQV